MHDAGKGAFYLHACKPAPSVLLMLVSHQSAGRSRIQSTQKKKKKMMWAMTWILSDHGYSEGQSICTKLECANQAIESDILWRINSLLGYMMVNQKFKTIGGGGSNILACYNGVKRINLFESSGWKLAPFAFVLQSWDLVSSCSTVVVVYVSVGWSVGVGIGWWKILGFCFFVCWNDAHMLGVERSWLNGTVVYHHIIKFMDREKLA